MKGLDCDRSKELPAAKLLPRHAGKIIAPFGHVATTAPDVRRAVVDKLPLPALSEVEWPMIDKKETA